MAHQHSSSQPVWLLNLKFCDFAGLMAAQMCIPQIPARNPSPNTHTRKEQWTGLTNSHQVPYLLVYKSTYYDQKISQKNALDLYTSHKQRPDQAVREINITTAWSALGKPILIAVDFSSIFGAFFLNKKVWNNKC